MPSDLTENHAMFDFVRTNFTNQFFGGLWSSSISYRKFGQGFFITGFDLTATGSGGNLPFTSPLVRKGIKISFLLKFYIKLKLDIYI